MRRWFPGAAVETELRRRSWGKRPSGPLLSVPPPRLRGASARLRDPPPYFLLLRRRRERGLLARHPRPPP